METAFFLPQGLSFIKSMTKPLQHNDHNPSVAGKPASDEAILKVAKEIVVKFIEVGRLSPANFDETFREIYQSVRNAVRS